jgi:hypothetical protein
MNSFHNTVTKKSSMPRKTTTRAKVQELVREATAQGESLTVAQVRTKLGGGSPNVILEELSLWRKAVEEGRAEQYFASTQNEKHATEEVISASGVLSAEIIASIDDLLSERLSGLQEGLVTALLNRLSATGIAPAVAAPSPSGPSNGAIEQQIKALGTQFDGMQRYMLMQISEARDEASRWKMKYQAARDELGTWRTTMEQRNQRLSEELQHAKGRLAERGTAPASPLVGAGPWVRPAEAVRSAQPMLTYPGHPRARTGPSEDSEFGHE